MTSSGNLEAGEAAEVCFVFVVLAAREAFFPLGSRDGAGLEMVEAAARRVLPVLLLVDIPMVDCVRLEGGERDGWVHGGSQMNRC